MSSVLGDGTTTAVSTFDHDLSPTTLPQHVPEIVTTKSVEIPDNSETLIGKNETVTVNEPIPSPLYSSQISMTSTKVNACDITLAVEDPFAIPLIEPTTNTANDVEIPMVTDVLLPQHKVDDQCETIEATNNDNLGTSDISNTIGLNQPENIIKGEKSELLMRESSRLEETMPVKEILVDTSEDAVVSLSSSRRIPVTAETAATADSSPSLQRGTAHQSARATRHNELERFSSSIASMTENQEYSVAAPIERSIDIHAITDNILAASACIADNAVWNDSGRPSASSDAQAPNDSSEIKGDILQLEQHVRRKRPRPGSGNCPIRLNAYLKERHIAAPTMIFQLTDFPPDDFTLHTFDRQIVHIPWNSPGQHAMSETPCIRTMLHFCYALSAWLQNNSTSIASMSSARSMRHSNGPIAIVSCRNGKTRTAIATSCYLKYTGVVDNVQSGFCHFLERRCGRDTMARSPEEIVSDLPASLHTFFRNFDTAVELGGYMNYKPLLLKAITVEGVPLEDKPCLDLWDSSGHHVYSTHPELWSDLPDSSCAQSCSNTSQWAEEEGFFRVNRVVQGDFCLLCRFGGIYAADMTDVSKVLFRYANSTAFMGAASPYELKGRNVDIQRRYMHFFDDDDFLLTLFFEAHWNASETQAEILATNCTDDILQAVLSGVDAQELGWHIIAQHHVAKPQLDDFMKLTTESLGELDGCSNHLLSLALQLANFDYTMAQTILVEGRLRSWWQVQLDELSITATDKAFYSRPTILDNIDVKSHSEAIEQIKNIMNVVSQSLAGSENSLTELPKSDAKTSTTLSIASRSLKANSESYYISPIMRPNAGDIVSVLHTSKVSTIFQNSDSFCIADRPIFPVIPRRRKRGAPVPIEHPDNNSAMELLLRLDHPGVELKDLRNVKESLSAAHMANESISPISNEATEAPIKNVMHEIETADKTDKSHNGALNPNAFVDNNNNTVEMSLPSYSISDSNSTDEIPIKDDPLYQKYFKMKKMGLPEGAVRNAMARDGVDTKVLDLDPERSFTSQTLSESAATNGVPIKDDPLYQKYFKMKKMGLPDGAVRNAMIRDSVDTKVLDLDPERSLVSQTQGESSGAADVAIKDDPLYQKYFKMKKMGLPDGAVRNAMVRDGVDAKVLDLDPERSFTSQTLSERTATNDIPIKDDPLYQKYFKMKKMGLPDGAVRNAMIRDGVDTKVLDLDSERSFTSQAKSESSAIVDIAIKDDPLYQKYFKMKTMGLPDGAVRNAMIRDGVDTRALDLDPEKSFASQSQGESSGAADIAINDDPLYQKYFKMKKMGLPDGAVRNAMIKDGLNPSILDLDQNKSLSSQLPTNQNGSNIPLQDDPEWSKYFKMLRMGLPVGAVKNAADKDGKDSSILDLDPTKSVSSQLNNIGTPQSNQFLLQKKKKPMKRKKIFWNPLNSGQIKADSLWSNVKGRLQMSQLKYDEKEFADLFTESTDPADKIKGIDEKKVKTKAKKSVQVIDGKRSMNGGIILARLKLGYSKIAEMVENMYIGKLDPTSLTALKEMLPTTDETKALLTFVGNFGTSPEEKLKAYDEFSECEKYMYCMIPVTDASAKFDCMLFRAQFQSRYEELLDSVEIVEKACDEVRSSERLQTVMVMILTLVNEINTGGDGNEAEGFTLDALLKLNEAKAFDKKTSVLHYLVKLIQQNNESLLGLRDDLKHLKDAELIVLDSLCSDIRALHEELEPVLETVKKQAEYLEEKGQLVQMSLKELTEQKTSVRTVASIPQYNKIDHHTGRTPIERFTLNAAIKIEEALVYTDKVKEKFSKVLEFFGEDGSMASNDFFGTMNRFLADFTKAVDKVHKEYMSKQREKAKEAKRKLAAELKLSSVKVDTNMPQTKMYVTTRTDAAANGSNEEFKNKSTISRELPSPESNMIQQDIIQITSQSFANNCVVKTNISTIPTDTEHDAFTYTSSNDQDAKQQEWLTKLHKAIMPHKLRLIAELDEVSDTTLSDDFEVTKTVERTINRQPEWLALVHSTVQKYKEQTL